MRKHASVVLLSGGLDSAANLALCREKDEPVLALTARYGQRAAEREAHAAAALCRHYDVRHEIVDLSWLGALGGSSLTSTQAMPELTRSELDERAVTEKSAKAVWVPNRNGVLINVGAAYAERLGAERVVVGFNREEAATFPDNSVAFMDAARGSLALSTANRVEVFSYTARMDKTEIVQELRKLRSPFPFELLWSCYQGGTTPCGKCESCQRLKRALESGQ
ncbi:MAG: 7-cyano-7-deazaguanine synthase QueC [Bdellovibrionota bacterium]